MTQPAPLHDEQAEQAVLGMTLLAPRSVDQLTSWGITDEHFHHPPHLRVWKAVLTLTDQQDALTPEQVARAMSDTADPQPADMQTISRCYSFASPVGAFKADAERLRQMALRRRWQQVADLAGEAARTGDETHIAQVDRLLSTTEKTSDTMSPEQLGLSFAAWLADTRPVGIPTGLPALDRAIGGGFRPGDTTVLAAHSGMGKSTLLDTMLTHAVREHGAKVHVYSNEMNPNDRTARSVARETGVHFAKLINRSPLSDRENRDVIQAMSRLPFGQTDVSVWGADSIARHARACRWDVWAVDLITNMKARDESELADIVTTLASTARNTGTHCIIVSQFNRGGQVGKIRDRPHLSMLKGSGALEHQARNALLLHRQEFVQDGRIETPDEGTIDVAKATHGIRGVSVPVVFRPARMAFFTVGDEPAVRAVA